VVHTIKCVTEFLACKCESDALARTLFFLSYRGLKTPSRPKTRKINVPPICSSHTKTQAVPVLIYTPRSEGIRWSRIIDPRILKLDTMWRRVVSFMVPPFYPGGNIVR
jgi:hypothetical protein